MSTLFYGADSADFSTNVMPVLQRTWGVAPAVYARYIGQYSITPDEVSYLKGLGVRIVLVYNLGGVWGDDGASQAADAVARMHALGLKTLLFKDIETSMVPSPAWLLGWSQYLQQAGVPGGFYANTEWAAFDDPYNQIVGQVDRIHRLVWTSEPEPGYFPPSNPPAWNPYTPSADPSAVVGWQFSENDLGQIVDLNLWTEEAYTLAGGGPPPAPPTPAPKHYRIATACDLKVAPSHASGVAIDTKRRPVHLEAGAYVVPQGSPTRTDDTWQAVTIPLTPVHGWVVASAIKGG